MKKILLLTISLFHFVLGFSQSCTFSIQPNGATGVDAQIFSNIPSSNFGTSGELTAAAWTAGGSANLRSLIKFDVSSNPTNAIVTQATLTLYNDPSSGQALGNGEHTSLTGSNEAWIQKITSYWHEDSVTWGNQPSSDTTNQAILQQSTNAHQDYAIDISSLIQGMISNPSTNFGFLLRIQDENPFRALLFASSDNLDSTNWPKLEVTYTIPPASISASGSTTFCDGGYVILNANSGMGLSYQWQKDSVDIIGGTDSSYSAFASGIYSCIVSSSCGGDTSNSLTINILSHTSNSIAETACQSYTSPSGIMYTISGIYSDTIPNAEGCDSVISINLTVNNADTSVSEAGITLTSNAVGATYQWIDCGNGNIPISGDTNQIFTATVNGSYAVVVTENGCSDTSSCHNIMNVGVVNNNLNSKIVIYPNPVKKDFKIYATDKYYGSIKKLELINLLGEKLDFTANLQNNSEGVFDVSQLARGIYFLKADFENTTVLLKFVKE